MGLPAAVKQSIQASYSAFLKAKNLAPRRGQKLMIAAIARALGRIYDEGEPICAVEAGTGTGKTIAYLLATIPVAKALDKIVVVATATVALQEQVVLKDLPELRLHAGLDFEFGLAKGRGRYLCLYKLDQLVSGALDFLLPLGEEAQAAPGQREMALYQRMLGDLAEGRWDGDKDNWPDELDPHAWQRVTTDHRQCMGRKCDFVRQCAFFKARDRLQELDVIVANHDLVLADLALGGGAILPPPEQAIYIFDEGHHLPAKALDHFSAHTRVSATARWLGQTEGQWPKALEGMESAAALQQLAAPVTALLATTRARLEPLQPLLARLIPATESRQGVRRFRFPHGVVGDPLEAAAAALASDFSELARAFEQLATEAERLLELGDAQPPRADLERALSQFSSAASRANANNRLFTFYRATAPVPDWPVARWVTLVEQGEYVDFELVASPVFASKTLSEQLWKRCAGAVVTSATLTALGQFDRFLVRSGAPSGAVFEVVPSPFDFARQGLLAVPRRAAEGNRAELHTARVIELLPELIDITEGTLVLFASRRQLEDVLAGLPVDLQALVLAQGAAAKHLLLTEHRARIEQGRGSVIFGLASFAEGVDLPGAQCRHVIIAKLPFTVPDDPLEAAEAEWLEARGGNAFMEISVPDAAVKLVQACGRLLRNEADQGRITILDRRLASKPYGRLMLAALPPFQQELNA